MEKYNNIVKSAEVRKLVENRLYEKALIILESMDISKIKVLTDLSIFAEVYMQMGQYQEAKVILLKIRAKSNSRKVIYQLIKVSIRMNDIDMAEDYYQAYIDIAPRDSDKYILRFRIDKLKKEDYSVLIKSLEALKAYDYMEKWAYELAKLYHKAGLKDKCVRECSDIILWFGEGAIVEKARLLREYYLEGNQMIDNILTKEVSKQSEVPKQTEVPKQSEVPKQTEVLKQSEVQKPIEKHEQEEQIKADEQEADEQEAEEQDADKQIKAANVDSNSTVSHKEKKSNTTESDTVTDEKYNLNHTTDLVNLSEEITSILEKQLQGFYTQEEDVRSQVDLVKKDFELENSDQKDSRLNDSNLKEYKEEDLLTIDSEEKNPHSEKEATKVVQEKLDSENKTEPLKKDQKTENISMEKEKESEKEPTYKVDEDEFFVENEELRKIFKTYLVIPGIAEPLSKYIKEVANGDRTAIFLISGPKQSGKTTLSMMITAALYKMNRLQSSQIAKINADKLNQVNIIDRKERLKNGTVIIEQAGALYSDKINEIMEMVEQLEEEIVVFMEDEGYHLNAMLQRNQQLNRYISIQMPDYSEADLLGLAMDYFQNSEYVLEEGVKMSLENMIHEINEGEEKKLYVMFEKLKEVKKKADQRNMEALMGAIKSSDYQTTDLEMIKACDFELI